ncbi:hypothetical protein [Candidatus Formimonas warabiya]|uniref:Uncharacterized protein n=1 Tax=Formimonas warabiya TaxID=1761012 RepID=A0A3G1KWH8_FORW1|nr:hypothetical protein [Candidatus Formimonas warabiya]ATW26791.1 hypothetical protein DCMF_20280 [Candidatus Formimonas warabiya]
MILYVLKCDQGYIRHREFQDFTNASLEKASVFSPEQYDQIKRARDGAKKAGMKNVRLVELTITEKELEMI